MDNIDNLQLQFAIASIINGLVYIIILIASIILLVKKRSTATLILFSGCILNTLGFIGGFLYNAFAAQNGTEAILSAQLNLNYFNAFAFLVFGVGLLMLALTYYYKKSS